MAAGINDKDQVVGMRKAGVFPHSNNFPYFHGFLWQNGVTTDLGTFGGRYSSGSGINDQGQILGEASTPGRDSHGFPLRHACLWQNGHMTDLTTLPGCKTIDICGFDGHGGVYMAAYPKQPPGVQHVYLYAHRTLQDLGVLYGRKVVARAVNPNGQIVGSYDTGRTDDVQGGQAVPITHAFFWHDGTLHALGVPPGYILSEAVGINSQGQIIGFATDRSGPRSRTQAFLWKNGRFQDLGTLGGSISEPYAINNKGQVVGFSATKRGDLELHGFLWEKGRMQDLNFLIPKRTKWLDLGGGAGINDLGQIVGDGTTNDAATADGNRYVHSYLLTPK